MRRIGSKRWFAHETRRQRVQFWGRKYVIRPALLQWVHGDGRQVIYFTPLNTRPNYYIVRIDSGVDIESDAFYDEVLEDIYERIEEEFGTATEEYVSDKNRRTYARHNKFPALDDSSGSAWGLIGVNERGAAQEEGR